MAEGLLRGVFFEFILQVIEEVLFTFKGRWVPVINLVAAVLPIDSPRKHIRIIFKIQFLEDIIILHPKARERTAELRRWLEGIGEGDVCGGSYPWKPRSDLP